jgi:hypothetical protein
MTQLNNVTKRCDDLETLLHDSEARQKDMSTFDLTQIYLVNIEPSKGALKEILTWLKRVEKIIDFEKCDMRLAR